MLGPPPTTNSKPSIPGAVVRNEIVPSGFLREATSALPLAEVEDRRRPAWLTAISPSAALAYAAASFAPRAGSAGTVRSLRSAASSSKNVLPCGGDLGVRLGLAVEEHLEQLAAELAAEDPAGIGVRQDHGAHVLLGQPDHVAVEADHVAAVVDDGMPYFVSTMSPMP